MSTLPTKEQLLAWIRDNPGETSKRDLARAFGIKGADRITLKKMLKELAAEGEIMGARKHIREPGALPPVSVLRVNGPDQDGDLWASPAQWEDDGPEPRILMQMRPHEPALGEGDRILARLTPGTEPGVAYVGRLIRRIGHGPRKIIGLYRAGEDTGRILSIDRKSGHEWIVPNAERHGAADGELVEAEQSGPKDRMGLPRARVTARLGDPSAPKAVSLIAIHAHGIPDEFPASVLDAAEAAKPVTLGKRTDLRHLPLITIDPEDARDHDDAVCALPDPNVEGGHIVWVAIADVAHYVRVGSPLDEEARNRGNSTYFPDRVVPMLPEALSADLCSLVPGQDRPCIALEIHLDPNGVKTSHRFHRALMRSPAALTYRAVQAAIDGQPDAETEPLLDDVLRPLWAAHKAAARARDQRAPLNLDLPERHIVLSDTGEVTSVAFRERLEAHRLIEDFMVLANVCAAETLEKKRHPLIYRVHEEPGPEKLDALRKVAEAAGLSLAKGQVLSTRSLNRLLDQAAGLDEAELINLSVLRSMTQAYYFPQNFGHFGLSLRAYAHFTSPIRRYADLIVHRALISAHGWGKDGLTAEDAERLEATAEWISQTERRSMQAERETTDRYLAAYLADRVGNEFAGRVSGIARFGIFVKLEETGADGLVPIRSLGDEFFHYDREAQTLMGDRSGRIIALGQRALVRLTEAEAVTGGLIFEVLELEGESLPRGSAERPGRHVSRRKPGKAKARKAKTARKIKRKNRG
ncbi:ribonuclease R [Oceanibium sediminis]|uniref:ribonuclease R n=1 Tax=Oceanibium sediminis TaxID=2026339 RepID=UPI000DD3B4C2|nr:ribonuclease R [Oceanibium sediminis]